MSRRTLSVWSGEMAAERVESLSDTILEEGISFAMLRTKPIAARQDGTNFDCHF
jgi:hypothetical protein